MTVQPLEDQVACMAHVDPPTREAFLTTLKPGSDLDLRGTTIDAELLGTLHHGVPRP
jgi:hypothetical protein